jgi:hypothetical protein
MINKTKNRENLSTLKLNSNKPSSFNKQNIYQVIKKKEINLSNFDPIKYKKSLLNLQNPKKKLNNLKKGPYTKKATYQFLGPYNRLINEGGGFCKRLYNKNKIFNANQIFDLFPKNIPKYKTLTKYELDNINLSSYQKTKKINNTENILIEENFYNINNNINNGVNGKPKKNYLKKKYNKLNIEDVNDSIRYLKLNKSNYSGQISKKEKEIKDKNINDKINTKIITLKKKKIMFDGINDINNNNSNENLIKTEKILVKDIIEQFCMKNNEAKKFKNLSEIDNVKLKFSPSLKNPQNNYIISSNIVEYNISKKKINKDEFNKAQNIITKESELFILSKPKDNNINIDNYKNLNFKINDEKNDYTNNIIIENNNFNNSKKNIITNDLLIEKKEISEPKNDEININKFNININEEKVNITEEKKELKPIVDKFAKYKERLNRKNKAEKQKKENKINKIKNLVLELENKMNKVDEKEIRDKKDEDKNKIEVEYNIPVIQKKKMKKKIFNEF